MLSVRKEKALHFLKKSIFLVLPFSPVLKRIPVNWYILLVHLFLLFAKHVNNANKNLSTLKRIQQESRFKKLHCNINIILLHLTSVLRLNISYVIHYFISFLLLYLITNCPTQVVSTFASYS